MFMRTIIIFNLSWFLVEGGYSAAKEIEIRGETILAATYDPVSRPDAQTTVNIVMNLLAIDELDLKSQALSTIGWLTFEWTDSRLVWDPATNDDIQYIFTNPDVIWKPELVVDNSLDNLGVISCDELDLRVKYDGTVEWEPPMEFATHCEVDITYYPYDMQKCGITIVSWGYTTDEVIIKEQATLFNLADFRTHGEWIVSSSSFVNTNVSDSSKGEIREYSQITFWLNLKRRREFYNLNVIMPIFVTSLLVTLTFIVPVDSGEKLSYVLTVFLSITVLLTLVAGSLPSTSITTSVLGLYLGIVTVMAAVGILVTVIILVLCNHEGEPQSPCLLAITRFAAKVTCSTRTLKIDHVNVVKPVQENGDAPNMHANEKIIVNITSWPAVAKVLDRFCFLIFSILTVVVNFSFVIALSAGEN